jgi:hypothetical protein
MADGIRIYLPYLLSAMSLFMSVLTGNKHRHAWLFGLAVQVLWLIWIAAAQAYGFLPLCLALFVIYTRNHFKWNAAGVDSTVKGRTE